MSQGYHSLLHYIKNVKCHLHTITIIVFMTSSTIFIDILTVDVRFSCSFWQSWLFFMHLNIDMPGSSVLDFFFFQGEYVTHNACQFRTKMKALL